MENRTIAGEYHVLELIGEGSFGKVYRGRRICSGEVTFVIRILSLVVLSSIITKVTLGFMFYRTKSIEYSGQN